MPAVMPSTMLLPTPEAHSQAPDTMPLIDSQSPETPDLMSFQRNSQSTLKASWTAQTSRPTPAARSKSGAVAAIQAEAAAQPAVAAANPAGARSTSAALRSGT